MRIYNYHPVTREYLGDSVADQSPLEQGVYLVPAHATEFVPPVPGENQAAVFAQGAWQLVPDHRGEEWFKSDGTAIEISELDVKPDPAWSRTAPLPTAERTRQLLQIQARAALEKTDKVALRCLKADVAFPSAWREYTASLRAIANGSDTTSTDLPERPPYPEGT